MKKTTPHGGIKKVTNWVSYQINWRRIYNELNALDDRTLNDLGIARYQILDIARKSA